MEKLRSKNVVVIGGGTGSFVVLSGLKNYPLKITAIVAVTDDGGSTGRLRDEFGFLPAGDTRQCIAALSSTQNGWLKELLLYRFEKGKGLKGHNLGNLILTALTDLAGSESKALQLASKIFSLKGKIYPISLKLVKLGAKYKSGKEIISEHDIEENRLTKDDRIEKLFTVPEAEVNPKAKKAILEADLIILGPGDLFNSTIANLIINGVSEAIRKSEAKILYLVNLMTLKSQTYGFKASDHVFELEKYLGKKADYILVNNKAVPSSVLEYYQKSDEYPVEDDLGEDKRVVRDDFLAEDKYKKPSVDVLKRSLVRHDPQAVAEAIITVLKQVEPVEKGM